MQWPAYQLANRLQAATNLHILQVKQVWVQNPRLQNPLPCTRYLLSKPKERHTFTSFKSSRSGRCGSRIFSRQSTAIGDSRLRGGGQGACKAGSATRCDLLGVRTVPPRTRPCYHREPVALLTHTPPAVLADDLAAERGVGGADQLLPILDRHGDGGGGQDLHGNGQTCMCKVRAACKPAAFPSTAPPPALLASPAQRCTASAPPQPSLLHGQTRRR